MSNYEAGKQRRFYISQEASNVIDKLRDKYNVTANEAVNIALMNALEATETNNELQRNKTTD